MQELASQRQASMRAFGTKAKAECSSEAEHTRLVAATKQARGDADSEADRTSDQHGYQGRRGLRKSCCANSRRNRWARKVALTS